jgi:hypothetical protein
MGRERPVLQKKRDLDLICFESKVSFFLFFFLFLCLCLLFPLLVFFFYPEEVKIKSPGKGNENVVEQKKSVAVLLGSNGVPLLFFSSRVLFLLCRWQGRGQRC